MRGSSGKHIVHTAHLQLKIVERLHFLAVYSQDLITLHQSQLAGRRILHHTVNLQWDINLYESRALLDHAQHIKIARQIQAHRPAATDDIHTGGCREIAIHIAIIGLELALVGTNQDIVILEAQSLGLCIELHSLGHVLGSHIVITPMEKNHGIDEERQQKVDQHTTYHDQHSLPGRFASELVWLHRLLELLGIETLIYHTRNLAVSTQWQPSQTISGIRVLWLELEEVEPWIEEQIKLLHSYAKELGEEKVSALMEQHQDGKR